MQPLSNPRPLNALIPQRVFHRQPRREPLEIFHDETAAESLDTQKITMADPVVEELNALFAPASATKKIEADVLGELQSIMRLHSIPPQELFYKWESYSMKIGTDDMKLDIETSRALKKDIQDALERESRNKSHVRSADKRGATPRNLSSTGDVFNMLDGLVPNTPRSAAGGGTNGSKRKINQFQTPSISRVKQEPASSPPEFKTPYKPGEKEYGGP